ncbi:TRAP transporter substrate-binding protein [Lutimaribacter saemankumensis]|uniref:TRAP-type C4-dicarboxylate transport system, substrate-binding protein n=1 Tax=Lutimaribacter saemankumensis TaxID=490829 RepID=A0A1G8JM30_9RHOB|nr:TRAP transporter substrate-binding protein [Lutimaribacter saemankumensis]SDI32278.1 TRAP-type C4-dicarboxylate transport system, substrate-binding protein [Lutimaribacter saemankumensis]
MTERRKFLGLAAGTALALTLGTGAAMAQEVTLKLHQFLPAQANVPAKMLVPWAQKIEEESQGRIKIDHYPSMQLGGKPPELIDQAIDGVADIVWTVAGYTPGRFPQAEVFELPFTMTNAEATSRAYWDFAEKNMLDADYKDFKVIALWVHGPGLIHSKEPITSVSDLNGVKLRAPTRTTNMMFSALGATPVGMPVPAVPEALSKGVIDATVIPWEVTGALKVPELVKNHTEFGDDALYTTAFIFAMNKDKYDALPDDLKAVIDANSGADMSAWMGKMMASYDAPEREAAAAAGNNIITLSPDQVAEWKEAAKGTVAAWVEDMNKAGFDGQALVDEAQALIAKYSQ